MEYVGTAIVRPERMTLSDPHHVGHITVRLSDEEVEQFFGFGSHEHLRRLMPDVLSSLSAAGSRATDVPGFQDVALAVSIRTNLDVTDSDAVEEWGLSMFQQIREILENM